MSTAKRFVSAPPPLRLLERPSRPTVRVPVRVPVPAARPAWWRRWADALWRAR